MRISITTNIQLFSLEDVPGWGEIYRARACTLFYDTLMKNMLLRGFAVFFVLLVATNLMMDLFKMDFGTVNYWDKHGVFFLFFIAIFPRLTLLFSSVAFGGFLWWLGFFFCPRILVASLATVTYFHTNPVLVTLSWLIALGGEVFEKWGLGRGRFRVHTYRGADFSRGPESEIQRPHSTLSNDDVIEAEFTKKS